MIIKVKTWSNISVNKVLGKHLYGSINGLIVDK